MTPLPRSADTHRQQSPTGGYVVPGIPDALREKAKEFVRTLGDNFSREIKKQFLIPLRKRWAKAFWQNLRESWIDAGDLQSQADDIGISKSQWWKITKALEDGSLSLELLLGTLLQKARTWRDVPPVPCRQEVGVSCYQQAITYAQGEYGKKNGLGSTKSPPTRVEFEHLLWLHEKPLWFALRYAAASKKGCSKDDQTKMSAIAKQVQREALAHLSLIDDAEIQAHCGSESFGTVASLEALQSKWGVGWMVAIQAIPYEWEV